MRHAYSSATKAVAWRTDNALPERKRLQEALQQWQGHDMEMSKVCKNLRADPSHRHLLVRDVKCILDHFELKAACLPKGMILWHAYIEWPTGHEMWLPTSATLEGAWGWAKKNAPKATLYMLEVGLCDIWFHDLMNPHTHPRVCEITRPWVPAFVCL